jgi:hypothetical protein
MSYFQFRQRCRNCKQEWNAAFGVVGTTIIASPPLVCWVCKSPDIEKTGEEWPFEFLFPEEMTTKQRRNRPASHISFKKRKK